MRIITQLLLTACFLITGSIYAQKDIQVSGKVLDKDMNEPLEYATIAFFSKKENRIVTGGITDANGTFNINVPQGTYDISVEYISYKTQKLPNKTLNADTNLGTLNLSMDMESLGEISIIAERTTVEIKLDKKIYTVGSDLTVRGGTVSDVLDNVPSVSVDVEGNVSLRGNDNVTILINGKPSGLVGLNSTEALRQLPAESIERVEVITSPSARYDAEGTAGILNIILKRSKLQGVNGAISLNAGYPTSAGASGNINYRTGNFNFFNTTGYTFRDSPGNSYTNTQFYNESYDDNGNLTEDRPDTFLEEQRKTKRKYNGLNTNFGVEWYINDSASLTTSFLYRDGNSKNNTKNYISEFDENQNLVGNSFRYDPEKRVDKTLQYAVNFDKQFAKSGHKFTFDFQYETSKQDQTSLITQDGIDIEDVGTFENNDRILLQADYVLPLGEVSQFELGYRGNFNTLDTDYMVSFNENGSFVQDNDVSNNLIYKENINALYSQFGSKINTKFSYLLGLRVETTQLTIDQVTSNDLRKQDYTGLFPTVNLGYEVSERESVTFGYNRRVSRPRSFFINPFPSRSSSTNLFQGNPDLAPSYSDKVDLGYLNRFGKVTLNSSIYFQRSTDIFNFISEATGDYYIREINTTINENDPNFDAIAGAYQSVIPVVRRTPINLATNERFGFEFTLTYKPIKKWNINGNFNLFQSMTKGDYQGVNYDADNLSWFVRLNNKVTLPGNIDWQTRLFYMGPTEDAQNKRKGMFSTDLAFSKDIFNEQASIAFNVSDVFNTRKRRMDSFTASYNNTSEFQWRERSFNLSFTYRFNQQKRQQMKRDRGINSGGDDMEFEG